MPKKGPLILKAPYAGIRTILNHLKGNQIQQRQFALLISHLREIKLLLGKIAHHLLLRSMTLLVQSSFTQLKIGMALAQNV